jgi:hypothetical protein
MNAVRFRQTVAKEALFRFGVTAAECVAAIIAGPFIVSYDNPLTATLVIAAITVFSVAIINPEAGLYLLILGTGYIDLAKRLGILAGDLEFSDVVIAQAVSTILFGCLCLGVVLQQRRLQRWSTIWEL